MKSIQIILAKEKNLNTTEMMRKIIITSYSFVTDACMEYMKSNMNEQWDLGGHTYAYKINHQFNIELSCDFQGKKCSICYYFNFFELFLNIIHKTP